jgi:nickel-dependent lactate racemase
MTQRLYYQTRHGVTDFELPALWSLATFAVMPGASPPTDIEARVARALDTPIGCAPLADRIRPTDRVAIIIEDQTRASPKQIVLKALLDQLEQIGFLPSQIVIVIGLGTHRPLSPEEIAAVYGAETAERFTIVNHDGYARDLVPISRLQSGTPVKINRSVHAADFRIGIGSIFAHPLNGFGGGAKILFPGVADADSILEHHLQFSFRRGSALGLLEENPFYEDLCRHAMAGKLDFIVNSVLDHQDRFYDVVCGDPIDAHQAGAQICRRIISQEFKALADITLISAFPYSEGPQIMKPLAPAARITQPGGCIILMADITSPLPESLIRTCEAFRKAHAANLRKAVLDHFDRRKRIIDGSPELNMALAQLLLTLNDYRIILVTSDLSPEDIQRLGMIPAPSCEAAIAMVAGLSPVEPTVHVVPAGGVILPIVNS